MSRLYLPPLALLCSIACMSAPANFANEMPCDGFYEDGDGDGFGGLARTNCDELDETDVMEDGDCDDGDEMTYPGAAEKELEPNACMRDADNDGYGEMFVDGGLSDGIQAGNDCNDDPYSDGAEQYPDREYYFDCDDDGFFTDFTGSPDYTGCPPPVMGDECGNEAPMGLSTADNSIVDPDLTVEPNDTTILDGDCDDNNAAINPVANEICDELDNNCDQIVDEDAIDKDDYYKDTDNDGYGDINQTQQSCDEPPGYVDNSLDCDDTRSDLNPTTTWYLDTDGDEFGQKSYSLTQCLDPSTTDTSYQLNNTDCDDNDDTTYPKADELCDGLYNNCDDLTPWAASTSPPDETDDDGDGFVECLAPWTGADISIQTDDCDDNDNTTYPEATEACDGIYNNCNDLNWAASSSPPDETDDDGDDFVECPAPWTGADTTIQAGDCDDTDETKNPDVTWYADDDEDSYGNPNDSSNCEPAATSDVLDNSDCDDNNDSIYPGAQGFAGDAIDQDCDDLLTCYRDLDKDGDGHDSKTKKINKLHCDFPNKQASSNNDDCDDDNDSINSGTSWAVDNDGDSYGDLATAYANTSCTLPVVAGITYAIFNPNEPDCDDSDSSIYPGAQGFVGDAIDQDCDNIYTCFLDQDLDGHGHTSTLSYSQIGCYEWGHAEYSDDCDDDDCATYEGAFEIPGDGVDQDCDDQERCFEDDDGDGYGDTSTETLFSIASFTSCADENQVENYGDCDDSLPGSNPGEDSVIDGSCCQCTLAGEWEAIDSSTYQQHGSDAAFFGFSMAALGDVNGDGQDDFIVGAPRTAGATGINAGKLYIYTSLDTGSNIADSSASFALTGRNNDELFGFDVAPAGDWNDDGFRDYMVSSVGNVTPSNGVDSAGAVFVYAGAADDSGMAETQDDFILLVMGSLYSTSFGEDLLAAPLFSTNQMDLVISDMYLGSVSILPHDSTLTGEQTLPTSNSIQINIDPRSGSSDLENTKCDHLASIPTSDGTHWLAIGNPYAKTTLFKTGEVLIFKEWPSDNLDRDDAATALEYPGATIQGDLPLFGISVLSADINQDNYPDLLVGAPGEEDDQGSTEDRGAVYIYYYDVNLDGYPATPDVTLLGGNAEEIGTDIEAIDLNGDGRPELAISSMSTDSVYLIPSQSFEAGGILTISTLPNVTRMYSDEGSNTFGWKLANAGDLIDDDYNLSELVVAAPRYSVNPASNQSLQGLIVAIPGSNLPMTDYTRSP